jgi:hypothetical protein
MGNTNSLFASLFWGSVGAGFLIYGKKQRAAVPFCGGLALIVVSYIFLDSALYMSLVSVALIAGTIWLARRV